MRPGRIPRKEKDMTWIESHDTPKEHPKARKAARLLGIGVPQMIGHLHCLWCWCANYVQDGGLSPFGAEEIAAVVAFGNRKKIADWLESRKK
jgi:hypothetical protein